MSEPRLTPIHMDRGDDGLDTPAPVRERAAWALENGMTHYNDPRGIAKLREAVASRALARHGLVLDAEDEVRITAGASSALFHTLLALREHSSRLIVPRPGWSRYTEMARALGYPVSFYRVTPEAGPKLDGLPDAVEAATIVINTPHNPTGSVFTTDNVRVLEDAVARGAVRWIVSDETYCDLVYDDARHLSPAASAALRERTVRVISLSKSHRMSGWRVGALMADRTAMPALEAGTLIVNAASTLAQVAAVEALAGDHDRAIRAFCRENLESAIEVLGTHGAKRPAAGIYLWLNIGATGLEPPAFCDGLRERYGVHLYPSDGFGAAGEPYVRLCFARDRDVLADGLGRVARFLNEVAR